MSNYFARLAALVQTPAASEMQVRVPAMPQSLEHDIEIDADPVAETGSALVSASAGAFERVHVQKHNASVSDPVRCGPPEPPSTQSMPAFAPITRDSSHDPMSELPMTQTLSASIEPMHLTDVATSVTSAQARKNASTTFSDTPSIAAIQESAFPGFGPIIDTRSPTARASSLTPFRLVAPADTVNRPGITSPQAFVAPLSSVAASPDAVKPAASDRPILHNEVIWPEESIARARSFIAPTPAGAAKASSRVEVRIGTIALEVRASPPSPVVAAPAPAAAAPSIAAPQFSPRRHYLRWS